MKPRMILAAFLAVMVAVTGALVLLPDHGLPAGLNASWSAQLNTCVLLPTETESIACAGDVWSDAFRGADLDSFMVSLGDLARSDLYFGRYCHESGHLTGRRSLTSASEAAALVARGYVPTGVCENGFLHGVLDTFGSMDVDAGDYDIVVATCKTLGKLGYQACSDGIGHSSVIHSSSVEFATKVCLKFRDTDGRVNCMAGVVMQMQRANPFTKADPSLPRETFVDEIASVCTRAEEVGADSEMVSACIGEAAGPFIETMNQMIEPMLQPGAARPAADVSAFVKAYNSGFPLCDRFGKYTKSCRMRIAGSVTWTVADDPDLRAAVCEPMIGEVRRLCLSARTH